jgi:hypothetical protein
MVEYLSLGGLAKALGRDKSGLSRHAKNGTIPKRSDGRFDLEAVRRALTKNVDLAMARPARRRVAGQQSTPGLRSTRQQSTPPADERDPVAGCDVERILVDGKFMTIDNAQALAETYRAALAKFQYDSESGAAAKGESEAWKAWVPRAADALAEGLGIDRGKLTAALADLVLREIADRDAVRKFRVAAHEPGTRQIETVFATS